MKTIYIVETGTYKEEVFDDYKKAQSCATFNGTIVIKRLVNIN